MSAIINNIGMIDYQLCYSKMQQFTEQRDNNTKDQLWIVRHQPVFTLGLAGLEAHILNHQHSIPIIRTDRGGQVTYHGPGQFIIYCLINLERLGIGVQELVCSLEQAIIKYLAHLGVSANSERNAPGVYVNGKKIAALGLKIRKGCTYHGISFNYNANLEPFSYINPCGYKGLEIINLADLIDITSFNFEQQEYSLAQQIYSKLIPD